MTPVSERRVGHCCWLVLEGLVKNNNGKGVASDGITSTRDLETNHGRELITCKTCNLSRARFCMVATA